MEDERVIDNQLTEAGLALRDRMIEAQAQVICRTGLDEDQVAALRSALRGLTDTLCLAPDEVSEPA